MTNLTQRKRAIVLENSPYFILLNQTKLFFSSEFKKQSFLNHLSNKIIKLNLFFQKTMFTEDCVLYCSQHFEKIVLNYYRSFKRK